MKAGTYGSRRVGAGLPLVAGRPTLRRLSRTTVDRRDRASVSAPRLIISCGDLRGKEATHHGLTTFAAPFPGLLEDVIAKLSPIVQKQQDVRL